MLRTISEYAQICEWDPARFFIISNNVFDHLIYYSHLLPIVVSIPLALIIFYKNPKLQASRWFLFTTLLLSLWLTFDLILWASEKPSFIMFFWSMINMIEPMIFAGSLFFITSFINGPSKSFNEKLTVGILLLPTILFASTGLNVSYFDLTNCEREVGEGLLPFYGYFIEVIFSLWILIIGLRKFLDLKDSSERKKIALVTSGMVFFLLSFSLGNIIGSLSFDWQIGQYGLFGVPVFIAVIAYLIVKYHLFSVKLISAQVLVTAQWILLFATLLITDITVLKEVVVFTLIIFTALGYLLIRSVQREVEQKELLQIANDGQENLIHIINHQIKGYLSKGRNIFIELIQEKDYGLPESAKPMADEGFKSLTEGIDFVQQILRGSSAESGKLPFTMKQIDFKTVVELAINESEDAAKNKNLSIEFNHSGESFNITGDEVQLRESVKNLINNSIVYTELGGVSIHLEKRIKKILLTVSDTGIGITSDDMPKLFTKGGRGKDSLRYNVNSTGYGLAFVKGVVEAHKGRVWAETHGPGKGSTFYIELPLA